MSFPTTPFPLFYRAYGVRSLEDLTQPRPKVIKVLPRNIVLHSLDPEGGQFPDGSNLFIENSPKKVLLNNVASLVDTSHTNGKLTVPFTRALSEFLQNNKRFMRFAGAIKDTKDENQIVVSNYNLLSGLYRYSASIPLNSFWSWFDPYATMWENMVAQLAESPRHHFLFLRVPKNLPARSRLVTHAKGNAPAMLNYFRSTEEFMILDLWRWIDPKTRHLSAIGKVPVSALNRVNFMFQMDDGRFTVLNLGYLNSFISGEPNLTDRRSVTQRQPLVVGSMLLVYLLRLQTLAQSDEEPTEKIAEDEPSFDESPQDPVSLSDKDPITGIANTQQKARDFKEASKASLASKLKALDQREELVEDQTSIDDAVQQVEQDLEILEKLANKRDSVRSKVVVEEDTLVEEYDPTGGPSEEEASAKVFQAQTPEERLMLHIDDAASTGEMNSAEYRRIIKAAEKSRDLKDPYGSGKPLREAIKVLPEDIAIKEDDTRLVADERILDTSMTASAVESFDKQYITKVMKKDVLATMMAVQNSGILVTNLDTETVRSVTGTFEIHSLTVKPIKGESSTLRIRVPVIDPDGTYKANNVRYHMRKQRVDLPIRKTDPSRIGISSYTGKLSVSRPSKIADKELSVVFKKINRASIGEEPSIPKVFSANVLNKSIQAPYIYQVMAEQYKGFVLKNELFGELTFDFGSYERVDNMMVCGTTSKGQQLLVNDEDEFFVKTNNGLVSLGDAFKLLDLDRTTAPVEAAELKVMGQQIPLGLVMGRGVGFRGLLKVLKVGYRVEDAKKRKSLAPDEYALTFEDKRFVFSRKDKKASLILGGLEQFSKLIKHHKAEVFDRKDIYDHLLDSMGCTASVARELDLLETSYVDPITQRVLEKMKEPTTFLGLMVRSAEHLSNYSSPQPQDMNHQEIRGYERIAGAVHKQLYKAIRTFKNRRVSNRAKVEMGHFAVWSAIREDRAIKTCEDINPIQNLKMHESVTFVGEGGRSKDAFMKDDRAYNTSDAGVISGDSVDSGDVGINIFLAASPKLDDVNGLKKQDQAPLGPANYLSTSILLAAGAQYDD